MDAPAGGARGGGGGGGGARGGRGRGNFSRGGGQGSGPPRGPASDRPRGQGGSGAMRGNPRREPVGTRPGHNRPPPPARLRQGEPHVNEGPTVEARVYGWKESKASPEECVAFLERKSRVKFTKVRLIIRVFIFALSSPPFSAASFCGYTFSSSAHPSWRCFFCTVRVDKGFEWVRDFWRLPRYYQRILIFVGRHGHEYKVSPSRTLSKGQKNSTCFQKTKKSSLCAKTTKRKTEE